MPGLSAGHRLSRPLPRPTGSRRTAGRCPALRPPGRPVVCSVATASGSNASASTLCTSAPPALPPRPAAQRRLRPGLWQLRGHHRTASARPVAPPVPGRWVTLQPTMPWPSCTGDPAARHGPACLTVPRPQHRPFAGRVGQEQAHVVEAEPLADQLHHLVVKASVSRMRPPPAPLLPTPADRPTAGSSRRCAPPPLLSSRDQVAPVGLSCG